MASPRSYTLKALTDIWTGSIRLEKKDEQLRERIVPDRLIPTGLLGSLRWWFEVVVRGLGGTACDPTQTKCQGLDHCVVCELFGCTGWARKFRFDVLDENNQAIKSQIQKEQTFKLRFTPLRPIQDEEWALLDLTIRLIAEYGAIGGKTVYKPSDEKNREEAKHHRDYGLFELNQPPTVERGTLPQLKEYVTGGKWRGPDEGEAPWASLANFWCVKGRYLARQNSKQSTFNRVLGRPEAKEEAGGRGSWLAGRQQESKKVFSFKNPECARRTFGFVKPDEITFKELKDKLKAAWSDLKDGDIVKGLEILENFCKEVNLP